MGSLETRVFVGMSFAWPGAVEGAQKRINKDPVSSSFEAVFGSHLDGFLRAARSAEHGGIHGSRWASRSTPSLASLVLSVPWVPPPCLGEWRCALIPHAHSRVPGAPDHGPHSCGCGWVPWGFQCLCATPRRVSTESCALWRCSSKARKSRPVPATVVAAGGSGVHDEAR